MVTSSGLPLQLTSDCKLNAARTMLDELIHQIAVSVVELFLPTLLEVL